MNKLFLYLIVQEFIEWLNGTIIVLHTLQGFANGERMASVITIMCILHNMGIDERVSLDHLVKPDSVSAMLSMLLLRPDIKPGSSKCEDLEVLLSFIPQRARHSVSGVLVRFADYFIRMGNIHKPEWLYLLPLLHLLKSGPIFGKTTMKLREIKWEGDDSFGLQKKKGMLQQQRTSKVFRYEISCTIVACRVCT